MKPAKSPFDLMSQVSGSPNQSYTDTEMYKKGGFADVKPVMFPSNDDRFLIVTDLNQKALGIAARLETVSDIYSLNHYKKFLTTYYKLRLSRDRESRKEVIQIFSAMQRAAKKLGERIKAAREAFNNTESQTNEQT